MPNIELTWQGIKECQVFWFESTYVCMHPREKSLNFQILDGRDVTFKKSISWINLTSSFSNH